MCFPPNLQHLPVRNARRVPEATKEEFIGGIGSVRGGEDGGATLDINDDDANDDKALAFEVPIGFFLVAWSPTALGAELIKPSHILWRVGVAWLKREITQ